MRKLIVSFVLFCLANTAWTQVEKTISVPFCIGETHTIKSAVLKEDRLVNVYLPATFDVSKTYPVVYLLDGSAKEDFLHIVGLFQFFNLQFHHPHSSLKGGG